MGAFFLDLFPEISLYRQTPLYKPQADEQCLFASACVAPYTPSVTIVDILQLSGITVIFVILCMNFT